jgi:transcriptional regulator with XRE-family HTH domain
MPPGKRKAPTPPAVSVDDRLRDVIARRGLSAFALGRAAGVDRSQVSRFVNRERDLTGVSFARLCAALGLDLVETRGGLR